MPITTWVAIPSTDLDADSPADNDLFSNLRDCNDHLRGALYDTGSHVPVLAHDHDGLNSTRIGVTHMPNLIFDGIATRGWSLTGASFSSTGTAFSAASQRMTKALLNGTGEEYAFGSNGCTMLVALCAKIAGTISSATFTVGWANGDASPSGAQGTFTFDETDLSAAVWTRVFGIWDTPKAKPGAGWGAMRISIATSGSWTGGGSITVDQVLVIPSSRLAYWRPSYSESRFSAWSNTQTAGASSPPMFDSTVQFTNAVEKAVS